MCDKGFDEELEGISSLKDAGPFGGQQPGGKEPEFSTEAIRRGITD